MTPKITQVTHAGDYRLELVFDDGLKSTVDFRQRVLTRGGIWSPLHNIAYFKQARIDPNLQTIIWPNGVDICPDVLYGLASGHPLPDARADNSVIVKT